MPPVWNQRAPSTAKSWCQSTSPARSAAAAVWPRSDTPTAPRTPKPRSVKLSPLRSARPVPSNGRQRMWLVSTPPCSMQSSTSRPISLSTSAVTTAARSPKHRRSPRATLYSPPPSQTRNVRALRIRPSPGSSRSITSPSATTSYLTSGSRQRDRLRGQARDRVPVPCGDELRRDHPAASDRKHRRQPEVLGRVVHSQPPGRDEASLRETALRALRSARHRREARQGRPSRPAGRVRAPGSARWRSRSREGPARPRRGSVRRRPASSAGETMNCAPAASASSSCVVVRIVPAPATRPEPARAASDAGRGLGAERHLDRLGAARCERRAQAVPHRPASAIVATGISRRRHAHLERVEGGRRHRPSHPPSTGSTMPLT